MKRIFAVLLASLMAWSAHAESQTPLRVGLLPTLSAKALLTNYEPLRVYLERELRRPVVVITSPDFRRFHEDTRAGDFDLALTAPHLARLAQQDDGFTPVATYLLANRAVLIMAKERPVKQVDALRGRTLAVFDPLALIVLQAEEWLEDRGLEAGRHYRAAVFPSQSSVAYSVQQGESLIGVTSPAGMKQLPPETLERVGVFAELPQVPALMWIVHPRNKGDAERFQAALLRLADSAEGAQFYAGNAYRGMRAVTAAELRSLDRTAQKAKRLMQGPR